MKKDEAFDRLLERAAPARGTGAPGACLDAETVAAWTDGSLTAAERHAAEAHAADCERCLALLAAMAKTAPPPTVAQRPSWLSVRWLVPLTTAAVAITAWVVIQESPEPRPVASAPAVDAITPAEPPPVAERQQASKRRDAREADAPARTAPSAATPAGKPAPPPSPAAPS